MGSASSRPQAEDVGKDASSDMANSKGIPSEKVSATDVTDEVFLANDDMDDDVFDDENDNRKFKDSSKQDAVKTQYGDDIDMDIKNLEKDLDDALSEPVILASSKSRAGLRTSQSTLPASPDSPTRNNHGGGSEVEDRTLDFWDQAREEEEILNEYNQRLLNSSGSEPTHNKESYAQRLNKQREERDSHPFRQQSNPQLKIDRNSEDWQIQVSLTTNVAPLDTQPVGLPQQPGCSK